MKIDFKEVILNYCLIFDYTHGPCAYYCIVKDQSDKN